MIDELAYAGPEHLDAAFVAGFDRKQGYPDPAEDLDALAAQGLDTKSRVVDLGAGSGQFALAAARQFGQVTAVDVSPAMLAFLRERAAGAGLDNVDCVRAGFLSYAHAGPPADGVYTRHALHQLPDFWKALALDRIARMLRPGGVLRLRDLIYDFGPPRRRRSSGTGSGTLRRILPRGTPARTTPSTSAPSTAPSAGCSSRCSRRPASRSSARNSRAASTAPTPASGPDRSGPPGASSLALPSAVPPATRRPPPATRRPRPEPHQCHIAVVRTTAMSHRRGWPTAPARHQSPY